MGLYFKLLAKTVISLSFEKYVMLFIYRIASLSQLFGNTGKIHMQNTASVMANFM